MSEKTQIASPLGAERQTRRANSKLKHYSETRDIIQNCLVEKLLSFDEVSINHREYILSLLNQHNA